MFRNLLTLITVLLVPAIAWAQPAPSPKATLMISAGVFDQGQSGNLGPATKQVIGEYWRPGSCPDGNNYAYCDNLQFGLTMFGDATCEVRDTISPISFAAEDGGDTVANRMKTIHNESGMSFCADTSFRNHDTGLDGQHSLNFPGGSAAPAAVQDVWWERPHVNLMVIGEMPQTAANQPDDRVIKTLKEACENREGGANSDLPSNPTWVMAFRKANHEVIPYGELLAAAGGTGQCCYGNGCNLATDAIDVCAHINDGRTNSKITTDLKSGKYTCGAGDALFETGMLNFPNNRKWGSLPEIRCLLAGETAGDNCSANGRNPVDVLGIMSCVRQLPRGVRGSEGIVKFCEDDDDDDCELLTEADGDISFVDDRKTMFIINDKKKCDIVASSGSVEIEQCKQTGEFCVVDGAQGRCAVGQYQCVNNQDECVALYDPMPEICNGLDDDCDGSTDNLSDSWDNFSQQLPDDAVGVACLQVDVCVCPGGATDNHTGNDFQSYIDGWDPVCGCGEGISETTPAFERTNDSAAAEPKASCSAAGGRDGSNGILPILLLGFFAVRRRKNG